MNDFYDHLKKLITKFQPISFYDLFLRFVNFSNFELYSLYIKLRLQFDKMQDYLKMLGEECIKELDESNIDCEFSWFPDFDANFSSLYQSMFYNEMKKKGKHALIYNSLQKQLTSCAEKYLINLKNFVNSKIYLELKEIMMFLNGFEGFLDEVFENIIKASNFSFISNKIYRDNLRILIDVKKKYMTKLKDYFDQFKEKINEQSKEANKNFNDKFQKSTRYIMREVEHINEIKCEVEGKNLKDEIEQDF